MNDSKHTPGPWLATPKSGGEWYVDSTDWCIAVVFDDADLEGFNGASDANARLIAAAPDLMAELRRDLDFVRNTKAALTAVNWTETVQYQQAAMRETAIIAALAKAETR